MGSWQFVYVKIPTQNTLGGGGFRLLAGATTAGSTLAVYLDAIRLYEVDAATYSAIGTTYTASSSPSIDDILPFVETDSNGLLTSPYLLGSTGSYLVDSNGIQLNFIYNSSISDFKKTRKDYPVETIGGAYPFIIRGSNTQYKQFGFSGIISADIDNELSLSGGTYSKLFLGTSSTNTGLNSSYTGSSYKQKYGFNSNQNFVLEKFFRKKVLDWLTNGGLKVFKSDTEDMILGRVTDVTLSPMDGTSRIIYQVSFTFTEIDSIDTLLSYGMYQSSATTTRLTSGFENNSF